MSSVPDDLLGQVESGEASPQILDFVARGLVPLPPDELVRAVASVLARGPEHLAASAERSFGAFDEAALKAAVLSNGIRPEQIDAIARRTEHAAVLELLIRHKSVPDETLAYLAETVDGNLQDVIVTNQVRLLQAPVIVERLFENPRLSAEIRRRADEFLEEFFLKKEREKDEAAAAAAAAPEAAPEPAPADEAADDEPVLSEDEKKSLFARVSVMSVVQKIRLAYRGNKEERMFLVQDRNRLVSSAALKSPKTREADAETIANMKSVSEDVLRAIAFRRDWMRHYGVLRALVRNPRSPIDVTLGLVLKLSAKDMKTLSADRNVPEAVRSTARREVARKES
jgi:hypothetical protein